MFFILCMFSYFPHIFGKSKGLPLDKDATRIAFDDLTSQVNAFLAAQPESSRLMTQEDVAMGFIRVANEAMCRPIRALTQVNEGCMSLHCCKLYACLTLCLVACTLNCLLICLFFCLHLLSCLSVCLPVCLFFYLSLPFVCWCVSVLFKKRVTFC